MRAARIVPGPQGGQLEIQDIPLPAVGPRQLLVRVAASGLNRGEINQVRRATGGAWFTAGVGRGVGGWKEGDRVRGHGTSGQDEYMLAAPRRSSS